MLRLLCIPPVLLVCLPTRAFNLRNLHYCHFTVIGNEKSLILNTRGHFKAPACKCLNTDGQTFNIVHQTDITLFTGAQCVMSLSLDSLDWQ